MFLGTGAFSQDTLVSFLSQQSPTEPQEPSLLSTEERVILRAPALVAGWRAAAWGGPSLAGCMGLGLRQAGTGHPCLEAVLSETPSLRGLGSLPACQRS